MDDERRGRTPLERPPVVAAWWGASLNNSLITIRQDALWNETSGGTDRNAMLNTMPKHLLPYVLIGHIYRPLMDA